MGHEYLCELDGQPCGSSGEPICRADPVAEGVVTGGLSCVASISPSDTTQQYFWIPECSTYSR